MRVGLGSSSRPTCSHLLRRPPSPPRLDRAPCASKTCCRDPGGLSRKVPGKKHPQESSTLKLVLGLWAGTATPSCLILGPSELGSGAARQPHSWGVGSGSWGGSVQRAQRHPYPLSPGVSSFPLPLRGLSFRRKINQQLVRPEPSLLSVGKKNYMGNILHTPSQPSKCTAPPPEVRDLVGCSWHLGSHPPPVALPDCPAGAQPPEPTREAAAQPCCLPSSAVLRTQASKHELLMPFQAAAPGNRQAPWDALPTQDVPACSPTGAQAHALGPPARLLTRVTAAPLARCSRVP